MDFHLVYVSAGALRLNKLHMHKHVFHLPSISFTLAFQHISTNVILHRNELELLHFSEKRNYWQHSHRIQNIWSQQFMLNRFLHFRLKTQTKIYENCTWKKIQSMVDRMKFVFNGCVRKKKRLLRLKLPYARYTTETENGSYLSVRFCSTCVCLQFCFCNAHMVQSQHT